jgi:hypothetical protein
MRRVKDSNPRYAASRPGSAQPKQTITRKNAPPGPRRILEDRFLIDTSISRLLQSGLFVVKEALMVRCVGFLGASPQTPWVRFAEFGEQTGFC